MRFFKLLKFDICNGLLKRYRVYLLLACTVFFAFFDFSIRIIEIRNSGIYGNDIVSLGTFLFYLFGGMEKYIPSPENPFLFPSLWILLFSQILFSTLYYPNNSLDGIGKIILIASEKRKYWWISKCIWNIFSVLLCFLIIFCCGLIGTLFSGGAFNLTVGKLSQGLFPKVNWFVPPSDINLSFYLLAAPLIVAVALSLFQMVFSLIVKPIMSFAISILILVASAYYVSPIMIGNYAMVVRADVIAADNVSGKTGCILCLLIILFSLLIGNFLFSRYDILKREH